MAGEDKLRELYHEKELSQVEIAERFDVSRSTVCRWMREKNIESRSKKEAQRLRRGPPSIGKDSEGYEIFQHHIGDEIYEFKHHRLIAVAEYGFDDVAEKHVHHVSGVEWDNRPGNLELVTNEEHRKFHRKTSFTDDLLMNELYHNEDWTQEEIAEKFGLSRSSVGSRVGGEA